MKFSTNLMTLLEELQIPRDAGSHCESWLQDWSMQSVGGPEEGIGVHSKLGAVVERSYLA